MFSASDCPALQQVYRFPVRLKLADLQNRKDCADVTPAAEGGMRP